MRIYFEFQFCRKESLDILLKQVYSDRLSILNQDVYRGFEAALMMFCTLCIYFQMMQRQNTNADAYAYSGQCDVNEHQVQPLQQVVDLVYGVSFGSGFMFGMHQQHFGYYLFST